MIGEAIVNRTPVLSSHMDGSVGILGEDYQGYFPVGDADALAALLSRCEEEPSFLASLVSSTAPLVPLFSPESERESLAAILARVCESG